MLCDFSQGQWYHKECLEELGQPFTAEDAQATRKQKAATEGGLPAWITPLSEFKVAEANDTYWHTIQGLPIQRGYPKLKEPGVFSFERLLMAVRHEARTPKNARGRVVELVMENTWRPGDGLERGEVSMQRGMEALCLLDRWAQDESAHLYYRCPEGHVC